MMDIMQELPLPGDGPEIIPEVEALKGFKNPETLRKAQEARAAKRAEDGIAEGFTSETFAEGVEVSKPKGRGRPKKEARSLEGVESLLMAMHFMIATATGYQEMILQPQEAHLLADALAKLSEHYKIRLDGKTGAIMGLIYAAGAVYGPRAVTIALKVRQERKAQGRAS